MKGSLDRDIRVSALAAATAGSLWRPGGDRLGREPYRQATPLAPDQFYPWLLRAGLLMCVSPRHVLPIAVDSRVNPRGRVMGPSILSSVVTAVALGLLLASSAQSQTCFGQAVTTGCRVNGTVGECVGTSGDDRIRGTSGNDVIAGLAGNDRISGRRGDDVICGGDNDDVIRGSSGVDEIDAGSGNDVVSGGRGDDILLGGADNDRIRAGGGIDSIDGGEGDDLLYGGRGDDTITGGGGTDAIRGGGGVDDCSDASVTWGCEGAADVVVTLDDGTVLVLPVPTDRTYATPLDIIGIVIPAGVSVTISRPDGFITVLIVSTSDTYLGITRIETSS